MDQKRMLNDTIQHVRNNVDRMTVFFGNISKSKKRNKTVTLLLDHNDQFTRKTFISEPFNLKRLPNLIDIDTKRSRRRSRSLPQVEYGECENCENLHGVDLSSRRSKRRSRSFPQMENLECINFSCCSTCYIKILTFIKVFLEVQASNGMHQVYIEKSPDRHIFIHPR